MDRRRGTKTPLSAAGTERWRATSAVLALAAAILFGAATPLSKLLLGQSNPILLAGLLYLGAALFLAPWLWFAVVRCRDPLLPRDRTNRLRLLGAIVSGGALGPVLLLCGLQAASAASVSLWLNFEVVATSLLAVMFFGEYLGRRAWIANGGVVIAGVILAVGGGWSGALAGVFVVAACLCWGIDNNLTSLIDGISPATTTFWKGLIAGGVNTSIGIALAGTPSVTTTAWGLVLGGFAYGLSITLLITAAQAMGATRSQMVFATAPFVGALMSVVVVGDTLSVWQFAAGGLLVLSLGVMFSEHHTHEHTHEAVVHQHILGHDGYHPHMHLSSEGLPGIGWHAHEAITHTHPHWPDLHHRHRH